MKRYSEILDELMKAIGRRSIILLALLAVAFLQISAYAQDPEAEDLSSQDCPELQEKIQAITADRANILAQVQIAYDQKKAAVDAREGLEKQIETLTAERDDLSAKLLEARKQSYEQIDILFQQRNDLARKLREARANPQSSPSSSSADESGLNMGGALEAADEENTVSPDEAEASRLMLAELESKVKDLDEQLAVSRAALTEVMSEKEALVRQLVQAELQQDQLPEDVLNLSRRNEKLIKENATAHYNLGVLLVKAGEFLQASTEFSRAAELLPNDAESYFNLGKLYAEHLDDPEKAVTYFQKYLQLAPMGEDVNWVRKTIASFNALRGEERLA